MSRKKERRSAPRPTEMDEARNELFSHIHRCGVLQATDDQQVEWMRETIEFLGERYPSLTEAQMEDLSAIGLRFCRPVISRQPVATAEAVEEEEAEDREQEPAAV